jgi:23S rRNA pseudouridine2605 synthase
MRLNKFLSTCGVASRRKCDELIKNGKISVNGVVVSELGTVINEKKDKVEYNGKILELKNDFVYYKLNKPKGYISSNSDEKGRKTIFDLVNSDKRLFSIGRLDYNTEGLILLTNDGEFAQLFSHPSNEIEKEYIVNVEGKVLESELAVLRAGVVENGKRMPKAKVNPIKYDGKITRLSVIIDEGQNHQVRRMFEAINKTIVLLKRIRVGPINLGGLPRGEFKPLTTNEIFSINKYHNISND